MPVSSACWAEHQVSTVTEVTLAAGEVPLGARVSDGSVVARPLVVALHGAAYDARYFDVPGCSVHERLGADGFPVVAITRYGYPADAVTAAAQPDFAASAVLLERAIADAWSRWGSGRPGVVVLGHSVGAAIGVHLAASTTEWPLLGLAISGIGDRPTPGPAAMFGAMPRTVAVDLRFDQVRPAFYGPDATIDPVTLGRVTGILVPFPSSDAVEVNTDWPNDLPHLAARVRVPVLYALSDGDSLWQSGDERVRAFASLFTSAPSVSALSWSGAGHNLEHHRNGVEFVAEVAEFARRCAC